MSLACDLLDVMSRTSAVPDAAGIAAIVGKAMGCAGPASDRDSLLKTNINLDLAELLRT